MCSALSVHSQISCVRCSFGVKLAGTVSLGSLHPTTCKTWRKRHNLSSTVKKRISSFSVGVTPAQSTDNSHNRRATSNNTLSQAIAAKLEDGNVRAAIRLLISDDTAAAPSVESLAKLKEKHPVSSLQATALPTSQQSRCLSVEESEVRRAVLTFPAGSAGGPDGLRPQHIRDMLLSREGGSELLSALTAFVNMVLAGRCPKDVAPVFFGGRLLALNKKSGGIRPIVVGFSLRRLVSKCATSFGTKHLTDFFHPHQLGVGIPGGCEAAIHSARRYLEALPPDHIVVKLDFSNAFNSLHRFDMLSAVHSRIRDLYSYCYLAYSQPSVLFYGSHTVLSQEGPQQGDPLGPLLFCNTIHPLLSSLKSDLKLGYMDDVSLGGPVDRVVSDITEISKVGSSMGLTLNPSE